MQRHSDRGAVRSTSRSEARDSRRAQQPGPVVSAEDKSVQVHESVHVHYDIMNYKYIRHVVKDVFKVRRRETLMCFAPPTCSKVKRNHENFIIKLFRPLDTKYSTSRFVLKRRLSNFIN